MEIEELLQKWETEFKKGFSKPLVLFLLSEKDSYPYQITKEIRRRTKGQISIATTNIYPILKQLSDEDLIMKIEKSESQTTRKYYQITDKGLKFTNNLLDRIESFFKDILEHKDGGN